MIAAVTEQAALLREVPLFASLPESRLQELAALARPVALPAGAVLFERGAPGDALYVIRHGRLEVLVDGEVVREAGRGEVLGELALLTGEPRTRPCAPAATRSCTPYAGPTSTSCWPIPARPARWCATSPHGSPAAPRPRPSTPTPCSPSSRSTAAPHPPSSGGSPTGWPPNWAVMRA